MLPVIASSNAFNKVSNYSSAVRSPISLFGNRSNVPCYRRVPVAPRRYQTSHYWLVVEPTALKNISWSAQLNGKKNMFQTTNQDYHGTKHPICTQSVVIQTHMFVSIHRGRTLELGSLSLVIYPSLHFRLTVQWPIERTLPKYKFVYEHIQLQITADISTRTPCISLLRIPTYFWVAKFQSSGGWFQVGKSARILFIIIYLNQSADISIMNTSQIIRCHQLVTTDLFHWAQRWRQICGICLVAMDFLLITNLKPKQNKTMLSLLPSGYLT